jgi:hypothetical protein
VEAGIADAVADDSPKALANWDMSAFAAAPRLPEPAPETEQAKPEDTIDQRVRQHAARMLARAA